MLTSDEYQCKFVSLNSSEKHDFGVLLMCRSDFDLLLARLHIV